MFGGKGIKQNLLNGYLNTFRKKLILCLFFPYYLGNEQVKLDELTEDVMNLNNNKDEGRPASWIFK